MDKADVDCVQKLRKRMIARKFERNTAPLIAIGVFQVAASVLLVAIGVQSMMEGCRTPPSAHINTAALTAPFVLLVGIITIAGGLYGSVVLATVTLGANAMLVVWAVAAAAEGGHGIVCEYTLVHLLDRYRLQVLDQTRNRPVNSTFEEMLEKVDRPIMTTGCNFVGRVFGCAALSITNTDENTEGVSASAFHRQISVQLHIVYVAISVACGFLAITAIGLACYAKSVVNSEIYLATTCQNLLKTNTQKRTTMPKLLKTPSPIGTAVNETRTTVEMSNQTTTVESATPIVPDLNSKQLTDGVVCPSPPTPSDPRSETKTPSERARKMSNGKKKMGGKDGMPTRKASIDIGQLPPRSYSYDDESEDTGSSALAL